jgi:hypothetical protein
LFSQGSLTKKHLKQKILESNMFAMTDKSMAGITAVLMLLSLTTLPAAYADSTSLLAKPNTELPTLTIQTPPFTGNEYQDCNFTLQFEIIQPDSWLYNLYGSIPPVGSYRVYVYLNGFLKQAFPPNNDKVNDYTVAFRNLTGYENHTVRIIVSCLTYSEIGSYQSNVTQSATFEIVPYFGYIDFAKSPVTTIRGTYPSATPRSSPSSNQTTFEIPFTSPLLAVVILLIGSTVLLMTLKRKMKKPS